jgi:hypothetical protein
MKDISDMPSSAMSRAGARDEADEAKPPPFSKKSEQSERFC